jgi:hypothetical protein
MDYKICILKQSGEISQTIHFSNNTASPLYLQNAYGVSLDNHPIPTFVPLSGIVPNETHYYADARIHPDDSIRTIKMKLLYELHKGPNANKIQLRPSYEDLYLYGFATEDTTTLQLFDAIRREDEVDVSISRDMIMQILDGHPLSSKILKKIPDGDKIPYAEFESLLSEKEMKISVKTPLGILFSGGKRDVTFEVNPFAVDTFRSYLVEHNGIHYFDDSLLLNHGVLTDNTIYVCLADRVYESASREAEDYISRYYFPGLYRNGVKSKETLTEKRSKLIKSTLSLLTDERLQYYKSVDTFYEIAHSKDAVLISIDKGIKSIKLRLKNQLSQTADLEMLFKNMHCTKDVPYIKFNPGNRRENLYRFYFERTTRTGKKIPYLSRSHIMRMVKETGRGQQISLYLEGAILKDELRVLSNCYIHFESDGDIQIQLTFKSAVGEDVLEKIIADRILPYLANIGRDLRQTGYMVPVYRGLRDIANTKIVNITYISVTNASKNVSWEMVPCIYSICTLNKEQPGQPPVARLKRVENFKEMDAANILIAELYGQVQYGELGLQEIVGELVARGLSDNEETARVTIAAFISTMNEMNGEIVENPGFPINMAVNTEDKTVEISVSGLTSIFYLDTIGTYIDAIIKMTQFYKESNPLLTKLKKLCKKAGKFREVEPEQKEVQMTLKDATRVEMPVKFNKFADEEDFFAQFASDEEGEDDYKAAEFITEEGPNQEEGDIDNLIEQLRVNKDKKQVLWFDENEPESTPAKSKPEKQEPKKKQTIFFSDDEDEGEEDDEDEDAEDKYKDKGEEETTKQIDGRFSAESSSSRVALPDEKEKKDKPSVPYSLPSSPPKREINKKKQLFFGFDSDEEESGGGPKAKKQYTEEDNANKVQFVDPETLLEENEQPDNETDENYGEDEDTRIVPDGMPLKPVNPFLKKLRKKDPVLFMTKPSGKYKAFSVSCQPTSRHPVVLTQEEMDRTDKSAYKHAVKYGSDPKNPHYFICPRFWCFLTNSAISEDDVKEGKCGKIIPKDADKIPKGSYVYELNPNEQIPGFIEDARADGKCLPCCFKKTWDNKAQTDARKRCESHIHTDEEDNVEPPETEKKARKKKQSTKTMQYIYSLDTYPIPNKRWGFLPIPVQLFLQIDYRQDIDPNNPALLQLGKSAFLRYGVEQPLNQSFLGCFADIYSNRQGLNKILSVDEFRKTLVNAIDLDTFVKAHNGSLLSAFYPKTRRDADSVHSSNNTMKVSKEVRAKYKDTDFASGLDLSNKAMKRHLDDAILAYDNFIAYLSDPTGHIDHQYLWDFICDDNRRIIPKGLNLIVLEIKANDIIDRIELICPTNLYSRNQYDPLKDTVILLKHDEFYEPIYFYENGQVERFLSRSKIPSSIDEVLKRVEHATGKYCPGMPSLPRIYRFANPVPIQRILGALVKRAKIEAQVANYQGKTIGLMVNVNTAAEPKSVYFPCAPSARLKGLPLEYMDSENILREYEYTIQVLNKLNAVTKLPCKPVWKIKEDGMVVGFLTETNQFVPIRPTEDIMMDGLQTYEGVDSFAADKTIATDQKGDKKRIKMTKYIVLESQFYHAFRNRIRTLINQFANREIKHEIRRIAEDITTLYAKKIAYIERLIEKLIDGYVVFVDIDKSVLLDMAEINECEDINDKGPNCIIKENGVAQLVVPKYHLISKYDNEKIYVGRIADELIRNDRVKSIMYDMKTRLHAKNTDYKIRDDEFVLVQSALTSEYFAELDSNANMNPYVKNVNYEMANPSISVVYPNEKIPLSEQYNPPSDELVGIDQSCLVKVSKVIGNRHQIWERIFTDDTREYVLRDSVKCTYQPIIRVAKLALDETWTELDVKNRLVVAYEKLFESDSANLLKIANIMREQGKSRIFEKFVKTKTSHTPNEFQSVVMSDGYHITDMDIWVIANEYNLPIIVFNPNGLKGFFNKKANTGPTNIRSQWIKMGGGKDDSYHFIRSKIGSYANHVYEYNLIVPEIKLSRTKDFLDAVMESERLNQINTCGLETALTKFL